jgi:hypothetical protein
VIVNGVEVWREEYTQAFVPVTLSFRCLPIRLLKSRFPVQPYAGIGAGAYLALTGDNETHCPMVAPQAGVEFRLGQWFVLGLDAAYNFIAEDDDEYRNNLDYLSFLVTGRIRIPVTR